jgi:predicted nuclease of predicted toxin-antitoxin system
LRDRAARSLILLLDENLSGRRIIEGLIKCNIPVKPQTELMERGLPDEKMLQILARHPAYFLLTKDSDFHKKPHDRPFVVKILAGWRIEEVR